MPFVISPRVRLGFDAVGTGGAVVFVHGHALDRRLFRDQLSYFGGNRRALAYDLRGHGESRALAGGYATADHVGDLLEVVDYLSEEKVHLVGVSRGASIVAEAALAYPDRVGSLILVSPFIPGFPLPPSLTAASRELAHAAKEGRLKETLETRWLAEPILDGVRKDPVLFSRVREMVLSYPGTEYLAGSPDPTAAKLAERLPRIACPSLALAGERDPEEFRQAAELAAQRLPGGRFQLLPGCGHLSVLERPALFNQTLEAFLNEVESGS